MIIGGGGTGVTGTHDDDVVDEIILYQVAVYRVSVYRTSWYNSTILLASRLCFLCPLSSTRKIRSVFLNLLVRRH